MNHYEEATECLRNADVSITDAIVLLSSADLSDEIRELGNILARLQTIRLKVKTLPEPEVDI